MKQLRQPPGFTLIEILMALTLLSVGVLAVAALQGTGLRAAAQAERMSLGSAAAKSVAEKLMALPYEHPELADTQGDGRAGLDQIDSDETQADHRLLVPGRLPMWVFWNIAADDPAVGLKTVRVIAFWMHGGREYRFPLEFVRAREY